MTGLWLRITVVEPLPDCVIEAAAVDPDTPLRDQRCRPERVRVLRPIAAGELSEAVALVVRSAGWGAVRDGSRRCSIVAGVA